MNIIIAVETPIRIIDEPDNRGSDNRGSTFVHVQPLRTVKLSLCQLFVVWKNFVSLIVVDV